MPLARPAQVEHLRQLNQKEVQVKVLMAEKRRGIWFSNHSLTEDQIVELTEGKRDAVRRGRGRGRGRGTL